MDGLTHAKYPALFLHMQRVSLFFNWVLSLTMISILDGDDIILALSDLEKLCQFHGGVPKKVLADPMSS